MGGTPLPEEWGRPGTLYSRESGTRGLPPRPDRLSGHPRPPQAPTERMWETAPGFRAKKAKEVRQARSQRHTPEPPIGQGPVLESLPSTRGDALAVSVVVGLICVVYLSLRDGGFGWMASLTLWIVVLLGAVLMYVVVRRDPPLAVGADWLLAGDWVDLYQLTKIRLTVSGATHRLILQDSTGRRVRPFLLYLQHDQPLWDIVYNGVLHSVYSHPVETNRNARIKLQLPPWVEEGNEVARRSNEEQRRARRRWVRRERRKSDRAHKFLARWVGLALCIPTAFLFPFFLYFSFEEPLKGLVLVPLLGVVFWVGRELRRLGAVHVEG